MIKIVVLKKDNSKPVYEIISLINQSIEIINKKCNSTIFKRCIDLERMMRKNQSINYKIDLIDSSKIDLENLNCRMNGKAEILSFSNFEDFIVNWVKSMTAETLGMTSSSKVRNIDDVLAVLPIIQYELRSRNRTRVLKHS